MIRVTGCVETSQAWSLEQLQRLAPTARTMDIHCVTRWSMFDMEVTGVLLAELLSICCPRSDARFVSFISYSQRRHSTSLPLDEALSLGTIIATQMAGKPIPPEHGGPIRNIVPGKYFYKSVKWLAEIELLPEDRLGYWEAESGYHNGADPWHEQRYMAPTLDKRQAARLIESRNFNGLNLRSINAAGRNLEGLEAIASQLRDADFRQAQLAGANFSRANLSNAHFEQSDLRRATFRGADLEGANFSGADLRGADLSEASLFGSTFCQATAAGKMAAQIDRQTVIPNDLWSALTPDQFQFLASNLASPSEP